MNAKSTYLAFGFLISLILGIAAGYRFFGVGRDYELYLSFFSDLRKNDSISHFRFEIGFVWSAYVAKYVLMLEYSAFAAILMSLALGVKVSVFSSQSRPMLTFLFYLMNWYPLHEYTQIRVAVSVSILFVASVMLFETRWVWFLVLAFIASLFHSSSILGAGFMATAFLLSRFHLTIAVFGVVIATAVFPYVLFKALPLAGMLNPMVETYVLNVEGKGVNLFSTANLLIASLLISIAFSGSLKNRRERTFFLMSCAALGVFVGFRDIPVFAHRMKEVLLVFMVFIAVDTRLTKKSIPQFSFAFLISAWNIYTAFNLGLWGSLE